MMTLLKSASAFVIGVLIANAALDPASASTTLDKRLGQFGIEPRLNGCSKWATGNWPLPFHGGWKVCINPRVEFLQHDFHLRVTGPDVDAAAAKVVEAALLVAASAAVSTGLLTPTPDPASRVAAAGAAAEVAFEGYLAVHGLAAFLDKFHLSVQDSTYWA